jgi:hypothetical protein
MTARLDTLAHRRRELGTAASLITVRRQFVADIAWLGQTVDVTPARPRPSTNTRTRQFPL